MNLLSFYLCSEGKVFVWKSQNSCDGIFCRCELDFSQITTAITSAFAMCRRELEGLDIGHVKLIILGMTSILTLSHLLALYWNWMGGLLFVFLFFFSNCCLAVPQPTLDHSQGDSLTNLMLITAFVHVQPKGHWEPHNKVGSLSPT